MPPPIDLTGQRFGRLTVVRRARRNTADKGLRWVCRCDCGRNVQVASNNLRRGNTIHCGMGVCHYSVIDLSGKTFGVLTVLRKSGRKAPYSYWFVRCKCGLTKEVAGQSLRLGQTGKTCRHKSK
jgi:hypothetical protein